MSSNPESCVLVVVARMTSGFAGCACTGRLTLPSVTTAIATNHTCQRFRITMPSLVPGSPTRASGLS